MKKITIISSVLCLLFLPFNAFSSVIFGLTGGYHYDVGRMNEKKGIEGDVQQNVALGALFKIDLGPMFARSGVDFSYPFEKGRVSASVYDIEKTAVYFTEVPLYAGLRFPIRDFGEVYLGGGGAYVFSSGEIKTSAGDVSVSEQLFGFGIIGGIQYDLSSTVYFVLEWEYISLSGVPLVSTGGTYKDYSFDYGGSRVRIGAAYRLGDFR